MAKSKTAELSDIEFLIRTLRDIAGYEGGEPDIRLKACDRLAVITGTYRVERREEL